MFVKKGCVLGGGKGGEIDNILLKLSKLLFN